MPIGLITLAVAVAIGGLIGTLLKDKMTEKIKTQILLYMGIGTMAGAIITIIAGKSVGPIVGSVVIGSLIGELINLEGKISKLLGKLEWFLSHKIIPIKKDDYYNNNRDMLVLCAVIICASGNGIYGAMMEGFTGDASAMFMKAFLDLFCAIVFASSFGYIVAVLAVPQFMIYMMFFFLAKLIVPITTDLMLDDFKAVGGAIMLATGIHITKIKRIPVGNMLPSLVIIMPLSYLWSLVF